MAIGAKFVDVIPSTVENTVSVGKEGIKNYLFQGMQMSDFIGKKVEIYGYIYMGLQEVTGGVTPGGRIAIAVLQPIRPATGEASYHIRAFEPMTYNRTDVVVFLRDGRFMVVGRDECENI